MINKQYPYRQSIFNKFASSRQYVKYLKMEEAWTITDFIDHYAYTNPFRN